MSVVARLRHLDEVVLGSADDVRSRPQPPLWARLASIGVGTAFLLWVLVVRGEGRGWLIAAIAVTAVDAPALVAALRWQARHDRRLGGRTIAATAAFAVVGVAIVVAAAAAPKSVSAAHRYPHGCHAASHAVAARISDGLLAGFRVERVVVFASRDAAVASAVVTGDLDIGGVRIPVQHQPADYVIAPGPLAPVNDLARRISPSLQPAFVGGPAGTPFGDVTDDRVAAEQCAAGA